MNLLKLSVLFIFILPHFSKASGGDQDLRAAMEFKQKGLNLTVYLYSKNAMLKSMSPDEVTSDTYKRGDQMIPMIVYRTDRQDTNGNANLTYDLTIFKADGTQYVDFKGLIITQGKHRAPKGYYYLDDPKEIAFDDASPVGIYKVQITIFENVTGTKLECPLVIQVIE